MINIEKYKQKYNGLPIQIRASIWFLICMVLQKGISVITIPIFTRLLSAKEYGEYNVVISWRSILEVFITLKIAGGMYSQGLIKYSDDRKVFSSTMQGLTTTLVGIFFVIYLCFQSKINQLLSITSVQMMALFAIMWSGTSFEFWANEQRAKFQYKKLVLVSLTASLLQPIIGIILVINSTDKATARIIGIALVHLICFSAFFFIQMKQGKVFFSKYYWKYALMLNIPLIPHYLSETVLNSADRIMIGKMIGDSEAGIYSLAYSLSLLVTLLNYSLMQTLTPWIYQKIKDKKIKDISNVAYICLVLIAGVNLLVIGFAPEIIRIFAPAEYYAAIWVIPPIAMSIVFMFSYDLFAKFEFYYEKTRFIAYASIIGAILNVGLNYIFIQKIGYIAAGYTTLFCFMVYALGHYIIMSKICKLELNNEQPFNAKVLLLIYMIFMGSGFALMATYNYLVLRYILLAIYIIVIVIYRTKIFMFVKELISIKKDK